MGQANYMIKFAKDDSISPLPFLHRVSQILGIEVHRWLIQGYYLAFVIRSICSNHGPMAGSLPFAFAVFLSRKVDLDDLMLSSSLNWSVKLWRVKPAAQSSAAAVALAIAQAPALARRQSRRSSTLLVKASSTMLNLQCLLVSQGQADWKGLI
jgi:hypothetical protein